MRRAFPRTVVLLAAIVAASCSRPDRGEAPSESSRPTGSQSVLRLGLSNDTPDAAGPRETTVDLDVPSGWQTRETFSGGWTQPGSAPTLMLVASGFDDGRRSGEYEARREGDRYSLDLHPTFADNNVTVSFVMSGKSAGAGEWGHSTFVGFRQKGPVRVSVPRR